KPAAPAKGPRSAKPNRSPSPRAATSGDRPLRRLDGIGRVITSEIGESHHDLSHLRFLAPSSGGKENGGTPHKKVTRSAAR
ncbi:MAG TPA: hypothetical protein VES39_11190, partial [Rhodospirillales bacterium]|nr:hypothetical protein [Rhodospirillales bacterium]